MCGIVAYIGQRPGQPILLEGLKRLEYRGYDSSGVVTLDSDGNATLTRAKGKISELEKLLKKSKDTVGIGHTRWATHGVPSVRNAHPHKAGDIYVVHNGIIENYKELKAELTNHEFKSDTDTEVLAALIDSFYTPGTELVDAVAQALELVAGTYGIAVLSIREPQEIIVARSGSPLIIGVGDGETLVASDASALIEHTNKVIYLNDGEIASVRADQVNIINLKSEPISREVEKIEMDLASIQKRGYDHFLLKEIFEQPESLKATLSGRLVLEDKSVHLGGLNMSQDELKAIKHVLIVGCGTAYYAGMLASYYLEKILPDVSVEVAIASEWRYREAHLPEGTMALVVSQSGETADTLACAREIQKRGAKTLGIINVVGSTIAREVDGGIYVHAGPEISVASTKAFTSQVSSMIMFGLFVGQAKAVDKKLIAKFVSELSALPSEIENLLKMHQSEAKKLAKYFAGYDNALYMGRDTAYPTAMEGALKLKEISYIHAEALAAGELKHGSLALVDDRFFEAFLILEDSLIEKSLSNLAEVRARGGHVLVVTDSTRDIEAEKVIRIKTKLHALAPLVVNVFQQLFAYYMAVERGNDVDQPRNLAKSVTVE